MKRRTRVRISAVALVALLSPIVSSAKTEFDAAVLAQVQSLYGLDAQAAAKRLVAEGKAADTYRRVLSSNLDGYAGAWFDAQSGTLAVALSRRSGEARVQAMGATVVLVEHSLAELEAAFVRAMASEASSDSFRSAHIDVRSNEVVLGVASSSVDAVRQRLAEDARLVSVVASEEQLQLTADLKGAEGTRNATWASTYGGTWPCSTGAAHVSGYYTAGHCGEAGNSIETPSSASLGTVADSNYPSNGYTADIATVSHVSGWTPVPVVEGYSASDITVPAKWSGYGPSFLYSTVCRFGQTSGGPYCGSVDAVNQSIAGFNNVTRVSGSCSDDGDSGGPFVASADGVCKSNCVTAV
jgi:streptogrisin C